MKLKQTIGIVLISIYLLSVTAIAAPADNMKTNTNEPVADPTFMADFTATHDPNRPLTVRFTEQCIGEPVPYIWGTKYGLMTYFWGFGDKTTSILRNPVHPFKEPGRYKVYLRIQNAEGQVSKAVKVINVQW